MNETNLFADLSELAALIKNSRASYGLAPGEGFPATGQHVDDALLDVMRTTITPEAAPMRLEQQATAERGRAVHPDDLPMRHRSKLAVLPGALAVGLVYPGSSTLR